MATTVIPELDNEAPAGHATHGALSGYPHGGRGGRNIRRHGFRDLVRVGVLVAVDLVVFVSLRQMIALVRADAFGFSRLAEVANRTFPQGFLGGWQFAVALVLSLGIAGAYGAGHRRRDVERVFLGTTLAAGLSLYSAFWQGDVLVVVGQFVSVVVLGGLVLAAGRLVTDSIVRRLGRRLVPSRAVVVSGTECTWLNLPENIRQHPRFEIAAVVGSSSGNGESIGARPLPELDSLIQATHADTVLISGQLADVDFAYVLDAALANGCRLLAASRSERVASMEPRALWMGREVFIQLTAPSLKAWQLSAKRMIDLCGAVIGLVLLGPALSVIALLVKWDSPGRVIFGQIRLGARGARFRCYKFRSMREDAESILRADAELYDAYVSNHFKLPEEDDPRLTRVGRFLRKTSLDELPQLFNVLLGHMSLVGPRPIVPAELDHYGLGAPLFLSLKPGMTGLWAVRGRSKVGYPDRAGMELEYVRRWSLFSDFSILLHTLPAVVRRSGAH